MIEIPKSKNVYEEISSHVDIFAYKIENNLIIEPIFYNYFMEQVKGFEININIIKGDNIVHTQYPKDISYNVCTIGDYAIHNFKYTSKKIIDLLYSLDYKLINVKQGYTNCSIAVIDDNSLIVSDKGLYKELSKYDLDILFIDNKLDIKLLNGSGYSNKHGFIGGCISRIGDSIIVFGDLSKIDNNNIIRNFILNKKLNIIEFKELDVIDYGGIIEFD